jgi:hypothetical protein
MTAPEPRTGSLVLNPQHCKVCDAEDDHMAFQNASSNGTQGSGHWLSGYVEAVQVLNHSSGYGEGRLEIQGYGGQGFAARYSVCSANGVKLNSGATIGAGNIMCKITISNAGYDYTSGGAIQVIPDEATQMDHAPLIASSCCTLLRHILVCGRQIARTPFRSKSRTRTSRKSPPT